MSGWPKNLEALVDLSRGIPPAGRSNGDAGGTKRFCLWVVCRTELMPASVECGENPSGRSRKCPSIAERTTLEIPVLGWSIRRFSPAAGVAPKGTAARLGDRFG